MSTDASGPTTVTGLSSMATRSVLAALAAAATEQGLDTVTIESVGGVDAKQRVADGEVVDLVILADKAIDALIADGRLDPATRRPIVDSELMVAVPAGAPHPELGDEAAVRRAIVDATAVGISTGPSGIAIQTMIDGWGLGPQITGKVIVAKPGIPVGSLLADGTVDLGFQQHSELLGVDGIELVGPLPRECAVVTTFVGAVATASTNPEAAHRILEFFAAPSDLKTAQGMSQPATS